MNAAVLETIQHLEDFMKTADDALAVPREVGEFIHALILATGAKRGLEIGTSYGYSGLWSASALAANGGTLVTIDCDPRKTEAARASFRKAGLSDCVELMNGPAVDVIATLHGPFDYVLNDADKENCLKYVEQIADRLTDRAVVLTDNTISHAQQLAAFVRRVRRRADFWSVGLVIGSGMEMSVKLGGTRATPATVSSS